MTIRFTLYCHTNRVNDAEMLPFVRHWLARGHSVERAVA
jgi:hypothetical protein